MEKDLDRFEKLLEQHSFESLPAEEKAWVMQFVNSGEEYNAMREVGRSLKGQRSEPVPDPDPSVLASLQYQLHAKGNVSGRITRWPVPAWAAMLALVMAGSAGWYAGAATGAKEIYRDRLVTRTDTVLVASKPDTVIIERIRYRNVPSLVPTTIVKESSPAPIPNPKGVTMKEKAELEKLLVSGGL